MRCLLLRVGSLFSGIGGVELGLERTGGFTTAWFVENDKHAQAILRKHWPEATIYDDITTIDFSTVPAVDVLTGGFPCQDISNAGKRAGITGSRSSLWKHYVRAISILRPKYVFAENVAALTQRGLDVVLADLASVGYDAEWYCVSASSVGAPHRRDRIIIIAYTNDADTRHVGSGGEQCEESVSKTSTDIPYPNGGGCVHGQTEQYTDKRGESAQYDAWKGGKDVENSVCDRIGTGNRTEINNGETCFEHSDKSICTSGGVGWWAVEPDVGRVANGIPLRVDRIKRLGNAVVPQWAQAIGQAIKEGELK